MAEPRPKAVLVAIKLPEVSEREFDASRAELRRLVSTLGYDVSAELTQARATLSPAAAVGEGKLLELAKLTGGTGRSDTNAPKRLDKARLRREAEALADEVEDEAAESSIDADAWPEETDQPGLSEAHPAAGAPSVDLIAVDHDISPSQLRNLERATGVSVLDRTGVIIEIFHRHAKSREARLEVEIARLAYTAPRLRESPRGKERQQGRGAGEAAIELDRRKIRDRIAELREQLMAIHKEQAVRRAQRRDARRVALVGYTNAGKSSWMRLLTESSVLVENKLFATLDTTVRGLLPETRPRILVSDTVGFIKKLPHDLVASFRSTLDEALEASLLLHVVDASDPDWESQLEVTRSVLAEIGAAGVPARVLMNKVDRVKEGERAALEERFPDAWFVSARSATDAAEVHARILAFFESSYREVELTVPYDRQRLVTDMHENGRVLEQRYDETGVSVRLLTDSATIERLRSALAS